MGKYSVTVKLSTVRELERTPKKVLRQVVSRIRRLAENPRPPGAEKLSGKERYRIRQGDYRVAYAVDDQLVAVDVVKVGHRREVYRQL